METNLSAPGHSKRKLILAAIHLFAEYGVDSVSLRMINREAGHKNNSALHYHFVSKLCLIEAVDEFIQDHFDEVREPHLAALEARKRKGDITLREAMEVFVNPYVDIIESYDWGYDAVRTIARMEFDGDEEVNRLLSNSAGNSVKRFARLKRPLLPHLTPRQFKMRHNYVVNSTIQGFADYRNLHMSYLGDLSVKKLSQLATFYIDMGTASLSAPA
jgi:AcrR family transcriptional regulator